MNRVGIVLLWAIMCVERFDMPKGFVTRWSYAENCEVDLTPDDYTFYDEEDEVDDEE
jgi:hypothetical protein